MIASPMHAEAARVTTNLGGDPAGFAARQLTAKIATGADLILTMTRSHRDAVLELAPRQLRRTFTLSEAAKLISEFNAHDVDELAALRPQLRQIEAVDVPDPIGQHPEFFTRVGSMIAGLLPPVMELCRRSTVDSRR